jgi:RNA polymerase sigma-70 factor (ECF subfamily)
VEDRGGSYSSKHTAMSDQKLARREKVELVRERLEGAEVEFAGVLAAAREADEQALTILYKEHQPALRAFLEGMAPGHGDDLASETWISLARTLPSFEGDEHAFKRLLYTIARRRVADHGRASGRRHSLVTRMGSAAPPRARDVAEEAIERDSARQAVLRITSLLPRAQAEVILLRVVAGLTVPEVASVTGNTLGRVSVLQSRGLARLAARIGDRSSWERWKKSARSR